MTFRTRRVSIMLLMAVLVFTSTACSENADQRINETEPMESDGCPDQFVFAELIKVESRDTVSAKTGEDLKLSVRLATKGNTRSFSRARQSLGPRQFLMATQCPRYCSKHAFNVAQTVADLVV